MLRLGGIFSGFKGLAQVTQNGPDVMPVLVVDGWRRTAEREGGCPYLKTLVNITAG